MKFSVTIAGKGYLLTAEQLDALTSIVMDAEYIEERWVGSGKGSTGHDKNYVSMIEKTNPTSVLAVSVVTDEYIETIRLAQKLRDSENI